MLGGGHRYEQEATHVRRLKDALVKVSEPEGSMGLIHRPSQPLASATVGVATSRFCMKND